jgi:two-component system response regulator
MREREILLVEDNDNDIILTKRALTKANIKNELVIARDGVEAIDYLYGKFQKNSGDERLCPALILLDLNLPKVDGLEVLKRIRDDKRTYICPVVILTSSKEDIDLTRGYELGANSYIRKPVDYFQFVEAMRQLGLYWLVLNEPPPTENIRRTIR